MLSPVDYVTALLPTAQDVRDLINFNPRSITNGRVICDGVVEIYNDDLTPYVLKKSGGHDASRFLLGSWTITSNRASDIQRTITATFDGRLADEISSVDAIMKVYRAYFDTEGNEVVRIPRGFFRFDVPDRQWLNNKGESILSVQGFDLMRDFQRVKPIHAVAMPQGLNIKDAIIALLRMDYRTPDEGGRSPSGVAIVGAPQNGLPSLTGPITGSYTTSGVDVTTFPVDTATGYLKSPDSTYGVVFYNPFGGARADASTHAPIDPWNGAPMSPLPSDTSHPGGATVIWLTSKAGVAYKSHEGAFYRMSTTTTLDLSSVYDPFKDGPLPPNVVYHQPDTLNPPTGTIGTALPPLASWPKDYDGSGPYFEATPTRPVPGTTLTVGDPSNVLGIYAATIGQRTGTLDEIIITTGAYSMDQGLTEPDPQNPATNQIVPQPYPGTGIPYYINSTNYAAGTVFPAANWNLSITASGFGIKAGEVGLGNIEVYWKSLTGGYTHVGTLVSGGMVPFAASPLAQDLTLTASGPLPSFTIGSSGGTVSFLLSLGVFNLLADFSSGNTSIASLTMRDLRTSAGLLPYAGSLPPTATGTGVPWPDTNFPALAPSGCVCFGPNFDPTRIKIPDTTMTLLVTETWDKSTTLYQELQKLVAMMGCDPLGFDEAGDLTTELMPYWGGPDLPVIEWTFSNESPPPDGRYSLPLTQRLLDQQHSGNTVEVESQSNATGEGLVAVVSNSAPSSPYSFVNTHRREILYFQDDALTTQEMVETRALQELLAAAEGDEAIELVIAVNPMLSRNNICNIVLVNRTTGERLIDGSNNPYSVTTWTEELHNPAERIILERTVDPSGTLNLVSAVGGVGTPVGGQVGTEG